MARRVLIPLEFLQWAIKCRQVGAARFFILMKLEQGKKPNLGNYPKQAIKQLQRLNLIGFDTKTGKYHQRSWEEVFRILGLSATTCCYLTKKMLLKYSLQDLAYNAALQYHFRLQEDGGPTSGKPRNGQRAKVHIHPSIHIGGIAHSIMAKFFGRSIHWSQLRRISCQARGLLKFTRRRKKAKEFSENELPEASAIYRAFDITSEVKIRVRMIFHIPVWLRKTLKKRVFSAKEGVYVYG